MGLKTMYDSSDAHPNGGPEVYDPAESFVYFGHGNGGAANGVFCSPNSPDDTS